jgi:hypothetical protein
MVAGVRNDETTGGVERRRGEAGGKRDTHQQDAGQAMVIDLGN